MARISATERQKIVNDFLNATGRNDFQPEAFLEWLRKQPDHPAHDRFFSKTDAEAAQAWRVQQVRAFVSDLRVTINLPSAPVPTQVQVPAWTARRQEVSVYDPMDQDDADQIATELGHGLSALRGWRDRYTGLAALLQTPVDAEVGAAISKLESALAE